MGTGHVGWLGGGEIEGAILAAVCDINPTRLDWARQNTKGDVAFFDDYRALLDSGRCDAVIIATPHYYHPIIGIEAFQHGLAVISEKPVGVYTKKVREFIAAADKSGRPFGVMYNQRTNPQFQKMRELVRSGALGSAQTLRVDHHRLVPDAGVLRQRLVAVRPGPARAAACCSTSRPTTSTCGSGFSVCRPKSAHPAPSASYHNIEVEDDVTAYAEYENGATGVFITTTGEYPRH